MVLIRPCPPSAQYTLTSALLNAAAAAAYAATVADVARPEGAGWLGPAAAEPGPSGW
jgi:hypothetical protein